MFKTYGHINKIVTSRNNYTSKVNKISNLKIANTSVKIGNSTAKKIVKSYDNRHTIYSSKYKG